MHEWDTTVWLLNVAWNTDALLYPKLIEKSSGCRWSKESDEKAQYMHAFLMRPRTISYVKMSTSALALPGEISHECSPTNIFCHSFVRAADCVKWPLMWQYFCDNCIGSFRFIVTQRTMGIHICTLVVILGEVGVLVWVVVSWKRLNFSETKIALDLAEIAWRWIRVEVNQSYDVYQFHSVFALLHDSLY